MQACMLMFWFCVMCCRGAACLLVFLYFQNSLSVVEEKQVLLNLELFDSAAHPLLENLTRGFEQLSVK